MGGRTVAAVVSSTAYLSVPKYVDRYLTLPNTNTNIPTWDGSQSLTYYFSKSYRALSGIISYLISVSSTYDIYHIPHIQYPHLAGQHN